LVSNCLLTAARIDSESKSEGDGSDRRIRHADRKNRVVKANPSGSAGKYGET
jgi:hypothetical protein